MNHSVDAAQRHKTHEVVKVEKMEKAVAHLLPGEGTRSLWVLGELLTHKIPSHWTGGAYSLFEATTNPGAGPPPHVHHREDESFYVLEGEYEFVVEGRTLRVGAGFLLYVPKVTLHAHKNVGDGVSRMLLTQTPGGLYERFFEEVGKPAEDDDGGSLVFGDHSEVERIVEVAAEHGIEIPLPIAE